MGLFDAGQASQTTTPGALAPADIASRLFAIKLLLAKLGQGGGAPQTLGEYMKSGPRKLPQAAIGGAGSELLSALSQPGAFTKGPTSTKYKSGSPSLFQDIAGGLPLLLMLNQLGTGKATGPTIMEQLLAKKLGIDPSTLKEPEAGQGLFMKYGGNSIYDAIRGQFPGAATPTTTGGTDLSSLLMNPGGSGIDSGSYYSNVAAGGGGADTWADSGGFDLINLFTSDSYGY